MEYLLIGFTVLLLFVIGKKVWKNKHHTGPELTDEQHPSTFKKPSIEQVDDAKDFRNPLDEESS